MDYRAQYGQFPRRRPLPQQGPTPQPYSQLPEQQAQQPAQGGSRVSSSSTFPQAPSSSTFTSASPTSYQANMTQFNPTAKRTLSNATSSTSSTGASGGATALTRQPTSSGYSTSSIRRSTSSRSGNSPTSYVALMRKQKATVWCDRAQHEDPRLLAQQRAAKVRAAMEVVGGNNLGRASTSSSGIAGGVRSKIRHHGAPKASSYNPTNLSGAGVPMRLSASEVDEGESDDDSQHAPWLYHRRTDSGRSSLGSGRRVVSYVNPHTGRISTSSTPPSGQGSSPSDDIPELAEADETPVPTQYGQQRSDYFTQTGGAGNSGGSGSSGERENSFGNVAQLPQHKSRRDNERKTSDELRRRGSVDDRTMTMSGVRLFVANPDLSD
ncbi:hypothetical protein BJ546DRAFT_857267 [Cryomyces antarcticus]